MVYSPIETAKRHAQMRTVDGPELGTLIREAGNALDMDRGRRLLRSNDDYVTTRRRLEGRMMTLPVYDPSGPKTVA